MFLLLVLSFFFTSSQTLTDACKKAPATVRQESNVSAELVRTNLALWRAAVPEKRSCEKLGSLENRCACNLNTTEGVRQTAAAAELQQICYHAVWKRLWRPFFPVRFLLSFIPCEICAWKDKLEDLECG